MLTTAIVFVAAFATGYALFRAAQAVGELLKRRRVARALKEGAPTPGCDCATCNVRRAAPRIGLAMMRVATGKAHVIEAPVEFVSNDGVGCVRLVILTEPVFLRVVKPALDAEAARG